MAPVLIAVVFVAGMFVSASIVSAEKDEAVTKIKMYENQEYGFTIEYPSGWILNDTIPQKNKWIEIVSFIPETEDWSQGIYVNKWDGDLKDKDFDSNEYLENHNKAAQDWCSSLTILENGFACMNYSLIDQKTVSISGRQSFLLEETWTRIEGETISEVLIYNLQIPDGADRWTIIAESRKEILNETSNILKNSLDSFTLLDKLQHSSVIEKISPPNQQLKNNIAPADISCKIDFVLIFKASDKSPACVKSTSAEKLIERGWGIHVLPDIDSSITKTVTPEMAQEMVASAIMLFDEIGVDSFKQFDTNPKFHDGEIYVYVLRVDDGLIMAHGVDPSLIGKNNYEVFDADGINLGELIINGATENGAWIYYKFKDPANQEILPKEAWVVNHDGFIFGSGIYLQGN
jgi:hypothetical protein